MTRAAWLVAALAVCLATACGSDDGTRTARTEPEPGPDLVGFDATVNICPTFFGTLLTPKMPRMSEPAYVAVQVTDPDGDDSSLTYAWEATSGSFASSDNPVTEYHCDTLGEQTLTVAATDVGGCVAPWDLHLSCVAD